MSFDYKNESAAFDLYCRRKSVKSKSLISWHLKSIFLVGMREGRLEISELLSHTTHELFKWNNLLRSVLSVFIVIGLLGTLLGLADSLAEISKVMISSQQGTNEGITESLTKFLSSMKSAFAPSIWGVFFTIIGIIFYSIYIRFICAPTKSMLEQLTITEWVPQLYPTTSQKLLNTLQKSEEQMVKGYETASSVNKLITSVQSGISDFDHNLRQANNTLVPLTQAVSGINKAADVINKSFTEKLVDFTQKFENNVTKLTSFQGEINTLYQQMVNGSDKLHKSMSSTLEKQNDELKTVVNSLKLYEGKYIEERETIDSKLQKFLDEATQTTGSISDNSRKLIEQISSDMTIRLVEIVQKFDKIGEPLAKAANKIGSTHDNLDKRMTDIMKDVKLEYVKQNENNKQQIDTLTEVNNKIEKLLTQLTEGNKTQGEKIQVLSESVGNLSKNIAPLTSNVSSLSSSANSINQSVMKLTDNVKTLSDTIRKQPTLSRKRFWTFWRRS